MNLQNTKTLNVFWVTFALLTLVFIYPPIAGAQDTDFPTKPIKLIVAFAPGGSTDLTSRALAKGAEKYLGKPVVVENRPGGGGTLGPTLVSKEKPDGYTLGTLAGGAATWSPLILELAYDVKKDFTYIMQYGTYLMIVSARSDALLTPQRNLLNIPARIQILVSVRLATTRFPMSPSLSWPRRLVYSGKLSDSMAPFRRLQHCWVGHVSFIAATQEQIAYIKAGRIKPLVTYCESRSTALPDVPTWREVGYDVGAESALGIVGPAGIPKARVEKLVYAF